MAATSPPPSLGNLVRLAPLPSDELPAHPDIKDSKEGIARPQLLPFLRTILAEGHDFSKTFSTPAFHKTSTKSSPPSSSQVDILIRDIPASEMSKIQWSGSETPIQRQKPADISEHWVARRSYHDDKRTTGTAEWDEFVFGLRDDHSKHEQDFTPTLYDAYSVLTWHDEIAPIESQIEGFDTVRMSLHEMCHAMPFPLKPRCFPILVVTANVQPDDGFIAITIPVALSAETTPTSFYSSGRNVSESPDKQRKAKPVFGVYAAIERTRKITTQDTADESAAEGNGRKGREGQIEWVMATASDAKGDLPMAMQKLGIPGAVAKDVGFFLGWIRKVNPV